MNDIFDEVTRQMNSLKRQASKAERYVKLRDEMRAKLRLVLASKFAQLDRESVELDERINALSEEMRHRTETVQQLEAEHADRTQRGYAIETEIRENRERLNQIKLDSERTQAQRRHNEERCAELVVRSAASEAELAQAQHRLTALQAERYSNHQVLRSAAADVAAAHVELAQCQQEAAEAASALADLEHQQEASRVAIMEVVASASNLRNSLTQAEERLAAVGREAHRLQLEMATASSQVENLRRAARTIRPGIRIRLPTRRRVDRRSLPRAAIDRIESAAKNQKPRIALTACEQNMLRRSERKDPSKQ